MASDWYEFVCVKRRDVHVARRSGIYNTCYLQHDTKMTTMKSYGERFVRVCEIEREGARARERERE